MKKENEVKMNLLQKKLQITLNVVLFVLLINFVLIGALFNSLVLITNNGKMPVQTEGYFVTDTHFSFQDMNEVNNYYFTDIFKIGKYIYSLGDIVMQTFFALLVGFGIYIIVLSNKYLVYKKKNKTFINFK